MTHRVPHSPYGFNSFLRLFVGGVFLVLTAGLSGPAAAGLTLEEVVSRLQERYEGVQDLEAEFTQTTEYKGFSTSLISKGKVYLKKGRLRWDYYEPSRQQIFLEGDKVLLYVPEHQQVIKTRLSAEMDAQVPIRLLAGTAHLQKEFHIQWGGENQEGQKGEGSTPYGLLLTPRSETKGLSHFRLEVDPKDFLIRQIVLQEPGGNVSTFDFSRIRINRNLKDRLFTFTIPKGVVVVEQP